MYLYRCCVLRLVVIVVILHYIFLCSYHLSSRLIPYATVLRRLSATAASESFPDLVIPDTVIPKDSRQLLVRIRYLRTLRKDSYYQETLPWTTSKIMNTLFHAGAPTPPDYYYCHPFFGESLAQHDCVEAISQLPNSILPYSYAVYSEGLSRWSLPIKIIRGQQ